MAPYEGTQQWHNVHCTLQRHPAMAPRPLNDSTLQWHPAMAPRPLNHSTLQWHPAMAPSNGTTSTAPCNGILVPRPMRKSGSSPSPPIGSKNPYSYRYLGKKGAKNSDRCFLKFFVCVPKSSQSIEEFLPEHHHAISLLTVASDIEAGRRCRCVLKIFVPRSGAKWKLRCRREMTKLLFWQMDWKHQFWARSSGLLLMLEMLAESCRQPMHKHCDSIFAMKLLSFLSLFLDKLRVTLRYVRCKIPGGKYWSNCCIWESQSRETMSSLRFAVALPPTIIEVGNNGFLPKMLSFELWFFSTFPWYMEGMDTSVVVLFVNALPPPPLPDILGQYTFPWLPGTCSFEEQRVWTLESVVFVFFCLESLKK